MAVTMKFETKAIHAGQAPDPSTGAIIPPVFLTSTYVQEAPGKHKGYEYSRTQNPTRKALEECLAELEGGKYGFAFSSGMGAINTVLNLLKAGDHILACEDLYGGTRRIFQGVYAQYGISVSYVEGTKTSELRKAILKNTRLLWLETPTNPLLKILPIREWAKLAHRHSAWLAVDNTFATPYLQRPLELGADIVVHSTTKYLGGHSDVVGGAVVVNDPEIAQKIAFYQNAVGAVPGPLDAWLVLRGVKTLALRMERHCDNAEKIARFLQKHPRVRTVYYPGLPSHPGHSLAKRQMKRFGGMVSFELIQEQEVLKVLSRTKIFALAESLGGVESLMEHPATMTHASISPDIRKKIGISSKLIRLSVGIEHIDDLLADLKQALD